MLDPLPERERLAITLTNLHEHILAGTADQFKNGIRTVVLGMVITVMADVLQQLGNTGQLS